MKFKLNDRVIWKDDFSTNNGYDPLKGTIIDFNIITDLITDGFTYFITIKWDNDVTATYTYSNTNLNIEIDLEYQRDKILNQIMTTDKKKNN
jgi:hypothetical protein